VIEATASRFAAMRMWLYTDMMNPYGLVGVVETLAGRAVYCHFSIPRVYPFASLRDKPLGLKNAIIPALGGQSGNSAQDSDATTAKPQCPVCFSRASTGC